MSDKQDRMNQMTSLFAILISVIAMVVSIMEISAIREQQRADVWPYILISQHFTAEGFELRASSKGVGPALVGDLKMLYNGEAVTDLNQLIVDTIGEENAFGYDLYGSSDISNSVMAPGDQAALFRVPWTDESRLLLQRWQQGSLNVELCYCSIHDDCWATDMLGAQAKPTAVCR